MRMTVEEAKRRFPNHPGPVPSEYDGQWIAWNRTRTQILAHGYELKAVRAAAAKAGGDEPIMQFVCSRPFIGPHAAGQG